MNDQENPNKEELKDSTEPNSPDDAAIVDQEQVSDTSEEADPQDVAAQLENAQHEITQLKDAFLRAKAEEDNVRRRAEKEVANGRKFAVEGFAKEMLNVYDSLKLASASEVADDADDSVKSIHEGVGITLKQLGSAFTKFSLQEIAPEVGDKLDPNLHQAMSMIDSEDVGSGCIINVIQAGFELHGRLLRPAMVIVAK